MTVLERNFRCRQGEIDIIGKDKDSLVFVEVKFRTGDNCGSPFHAVGSAKQKVISRVAMYYLTSRCRNTDIPCRFDVIGIEGNKITWLQNAFDYRL